MTPNPYVHTCFKPEMPLLIMEIVIKCVVWVGLMRARQAVFSLYFACALLEGSLSALAGRTYVCMCVSVCVYVFKGQRVGAVLVWRVLQAQFQPLFPKSHTNTQGALCWAFLMTLFDLPLAPRLLHSHSHATSRWGGMNLDGESYKPLKHLLQRCDSHRTHTYEKKVSVWTYVNMNICTYSIFQHPTWSSNPKHLLTHQLLLQPAAFWGLPDQKILVKWREMAAADIMKRTRQKAIDLNVYRAAHGGLALGVWGFDSPIELSQNQRRHIQGYFFGHWDCLLYIPVVT